MKGKYWIIIAAIVMTGLGLAVYFSRRRTRATTQLDTNNELMGCVNVPKKFKSWSASFAETDWGQYGRSLDKYLGIDPDVQVQDKELVNGFFKAIDVEPRSEYVRYYQDDIRIWLDSNTSLPHWDVEKGILKC